MISMIPEHSKSICRVMDPVFVATNKIPYLKKGVKVPVSLPTKPARAATILARGCVAQGRTNTIIRTNIPSMPTVMKAAWFWTR